ncbi:metalloregulator ArsR/SmtB family transcription factor [Balneolales bacterium ANBcel1]|nr:metalloregulator ArsR/SmtB family transcription factor [Balneolales bacterium ANBcel1]
MNIPDSPASISPGFDLEDPSIRRTAQLTKALGHPVRLAILQLLCNRDTCFCGDFTDVLPLAQSTVSQHLKMLKECGLITGTSRGVRTCYCLDPDGVRELRQTLINLANRFEVTTQADGC